VYDAKAVKKYAAKSKGKKARARARKKYDASEKGQATIARTTTMQTAQRADESRAKATREWAAQALPEEKLITYVSNLQAKPLYRAVGTLPRDEAYDWWIKVCSGGATASGTLRGLAHPPYDYEENGIRFAEWKKGRTWIITSSKEDSPVFWQTGNGIKPCENKVPAPTPRLLELWQAFEDAKPENQIEAGDCHVINHATSWPEILQEQDSQGNYLEMKFVVRRIVNPWKAALPWQPLPLACPVPVMVSEETLPSLPSMIEEAQHELHKERAVWELHQKEEKQKRKTLAKKLKEWRKEHNKETRLVAREELKALRISGMKAYLTTLQSEIMKAQWTLKPNNPEAEQELFSLDDEAHATEQWLAEQQTPATSLHTQEFLSYLEGLLTQKGAVKFDAETIIREIESLKELNAAQLKGES
jgi:hypothetical protein